MRTISIILLFTLVSCAGLPQRKIASQDSMTQGEIEASLVKIRPFPTREEEGLASLSRYYLELRDSRRNLVDIRSNELTIKENLRLIDHRVKRISKGKYEVELLNNLQGLKKIEFHIQNQSIIYKLENKEKPSWAYSRIQVIENKSYELKLEVQIRNQKNEIIELDSAPEVIVEGQGHFGEIRQVKKGVWQLSFYYSEGNQIFYFSLRANDIYLKRLLRFQYVEK